MAGRQNGGSVDELLKIVAQLEVLGLVNQFIMSHPQHANTINAARQALVSKHINQISAFGTPPPTLSDSAGKALLPCGLQRHLQEIQSPPLSPPFGYQGPMCPFSAEPNLLSLCERLERIPQQSCPPFSDPPQNKKCLQSQNPSFGYQGSPSVSEPINFLSLCQRLERIPQKCCPPFGVLPPIIKSLQSTTRDQSSEKECLVNQNIAGSWSDGVGGYKVKSTGLQCKTKSTENELDGVGGRKPHALED